MGAAFPDGHFYSPVIDAEEVRRDEGRIWPSPPAPTAGVDLRHEFQRDLLLELRRYFREFDYPHEPAPGGGYHQNNPMFSGLDARIWYALLRHLRPARVIEVGSGYTSLLAADVNNRYFDGSIRITCVEPYPPDFLRDGLPGVERLVTSRAQDVPVDFFLQLEEGDILFIDSSHVSKTGSDVNHLYLNVLPQLRRGIYIHSHDIFLPHDYPKDWVLGEERSWNEQYLLQALLTFSSGFEVVFGCAYATHFLLDLVREVAGMEIGGGSFWMRKIA